MPDRPATAATLRPIPFAILSTLLLASSAAFVWYGASVAGADFDAHDFSLALIVGLIAQLVDGALGMAYGLTATSFLLATGASPVVATASVHIAEAFTTAASGLSHWRLGNVERALFARLAVPGVGGGVIGAWLITEVDGDAIKPWIAGYLLLTGLYVVCRAVRAARVRRRVHGRGVVALALTGGFVDAVGGGGWGPVVTSTLIGSGRDPRSTIGSVNAAEFFVTLATGFSFVLLVGVTGWQTVAGLITGGLVAAPLGAYAVAKLNVRATMGLVGVLVSALSSYVLWSSL